MQVQKIIWSLGHIKNLLFITFDEQNFDIFRHSLLISKILDQLVQDSAYGKFIVSLSQEVGCVDVATWNAYACDLKYYQIVIELTLLHKSALYFNMHTHIILVLTELQSNADATIQTTTIWAHSFYKYYAICIKDETTSF